MYDIIIIGSGPGGYVAAIRAAQLGLKTAIIESKHLGGICLNWGCIPTKALLRSAQVKHLASHASLYGLKVTGEIEPDINAIVERSRNVSKRLNSGVEYLMKKNKIDVIWGIARLSKDSSGVKIDVSASEVQAPQNALGVGSYRAKDIIIATGARPRILPGLEFDSTHIWSYFDALVPKEIPKNLVIVGSGAIGIEFASFYSEMGSNVTVIERMANILPLEDEEISNFARKCLEKHNIKFLTNASVSKIEKNTNNVQAVVEVNGKLEAIKADKVIVAAGVVGNAENLGLEELNIKTENNIIIVDEYCRTNISNIYAIGDVAGAPMLAHKAEEEGVMCVEKIAGLNNVHIIDKVKIPGCTYCEPQIASVGLSEKKAKELGYDINVGRYSFSANGKAVAMGEEQGIVKTIFDKKTGQLLGAHMVGAEVTEMIQGFVVAMNLETTEEDLMHSIFPHPTLSEMMKESVLDAFGRVLNA